MLTAILLSLLMVAMTVAVHAFGLAFLLRFLMSRQSIAPGVWPLTWLVIQMTWALILLHLLSIVLWACLFLASGDLTDLQTALYFSGVTYSTIGYGDVVLSGRWRVMCPVEGLTGILMCGLSTAFFFAVLERVRSLRAQASPP